MLCTPYETGADGPVAYDCLGLLRHLFRHCLGIELGSGRHLSDLKALRDAFVPIEEVFQPWDVLWQSDHVFILEQRDVAVTAVKIAGVCRVHLTDFLPQSSHYRHVDLFSL